MLQLRVPADGVQRGGRRGGGGAGAAGGRGGVLHGAARRAPRLRGGAVPHREPGAPLPAQLEAHAQRAGRRHGPRGAAAAGGAAARRRRRGGAAARRRVLRQHGAVGAAPRAHAARLLPRRAARLPQGRPPNISICIKLDRTNIAYFAV